MNQAVSRRMALSPAEGLRQLIFFAAEPSAPALAVASADIKDRMIESPSLSCHVTVTGGVRAFTIGGGMGVGKHFGRACLDTPGGLCYVS